MCANACLRRTSLLRFDRIGVGFWCLLTISNSVIEEVFLCVYFLPYVGCFFFASECLFFLHATNDQSEFEFRVANLTL